MPPKKDGKGPDQSRNGPFLDPILVTPAVAFRALSIGRNLGRRLIRERVIPTVKLPNGPRRVLVDELKKMLAVMVQVDRLCRTCTKKDPDTGKCAAWSAPPSDVQNCRAWSFDEAWNIKEFAAIWEKRMEGK